MINFSLKKKQQQKTLASSGYVVEFFLTTRSERLSKDHPRASPCIITSGD
jgi:hypothetical protein